MQFPHAGPTSDEQIDRAAQIISQATSPIVLAGNGATAPEQVKQVGSNVVRPDRYITVANTARAGNHGLL